MDKLNIVTYNGNGLRDATKRKQVFHYLHVKDIDIAFLQETHSVKQEEKLWSCIWGTKIWFSHGTSNTGGVAVLFKKKLNIVVHNVVQSDSGRFILLYVTFQRKKLLLVNVYAPNSDSPQFFELLCTKIQQFHPTYTILSGDLNLGIEASIDRSGDGKNNDRAAQILSTFMEGNDLVDVWQFLHPGENGFTWRWLRPKPSFSRLDYFITDTSFMQFVTEINILPGFLTDHSIVKMSIVFEPWQRGLGYWKLNVSLLKNGDYVDRINDILDRELYTQELKTFKSRWEQTKLSIRGSSIQFATRKNRSKKQLIEIYEKKKKAERGTY